MIVTRILVIIGQIGALYCYARATTWYLAALVFIILWLNNFEQKLNK